MDFAENQGCYRCNSLIRCCATTHQTLFSSGFFSLLPLGIKRLQKPWSTLPADTPKCGEVKCERTFNHSDQYKFKMISTLPCAQLSLRALSLACATLLERGACSKEKKKKRQTRSFLSCSSCYQAIFRNQKCSVRVILVNC